MLKKVHLKIKVHQLDYCIFHLNHL